MQKERVAPRESISGCKRKNARAVGRPVPREEIADLYTAYAYATAGSEVHARFPQVGRWLGLLPDIDTTSRETGEGDTR